MFDVSLLFVVFLVPMFSGKSAAAVKQDEARDALGQYYSIVLDFIETE